MTQPPSPDVRRSGWFSGRTAAIVSLLVTLAVGILIGVAIDRRVLLRDALRKPRGGWFVTFHDPSPADIARGRARLAKDLNLTPAQQVMVDSIMSHHTVDLRTIRTETEARIKAVLDESRRQIDSVLTPEQRVKAEERRQRWKQKKEQSASSQNAQ